jgi:hypothetical protein
MVRALRDLRGAVRAEVRCVAHLGGKRAIAAATRAHRAQLVAVGRALALRVFGVGRQAGFQI